MAWGWKERTKDTKHKRGQKATKVGTNRKELMKCFNSTLGLKITSLKKMTIFSREGKAHLHSRSSGSHLAIKALLGGICTKTPRGYPEGLQPMHLEHGHLFWGFKFHVSIFFNEFISLFVYVCLSCRVCECRIHRGQKRVQELLELELQVASSTALKSMLGIELTSSGRAASTLNHVILSPGQLHVFRS